MISGLSKGFKKVLLVTAPCPKETETPLHLGDNRPPLGLGFVAAYLEQAGHKTKILDLYHFGGEKINKSSSVKIQEEQTQHLSINLDYEINSFRPDFIGMYIHTMSFYEACKLGKSLKKKYPGIPLMCGGPHATVLSHTIPNFFDYVVIGEGEYAVLDIVEGRAKERLIVGKKVETLDNLPWPNYDWFIDKPYNRKLELFGRSDIEPVITFSTTRGCPFPCRFCGVRNVSGQGFRSMSPEIIIAKIEEYKKKYKIKGVYFREDNFTADNKRLRKFCDLLIKSKLDINWACESRVRNLSEPLIRKMAQSGCIGLYIGLESGSPRMLKYMNKKETVGDFLEKIPLLKKYGIGTYLTWMVGIPTETKKDRLMTQKLLERLQPTSHDGFVYLGIPRSYFYDQLDESSDYELKEVNGIIYPKGFLSLARVLYGENDGRCMYVESLYEKNNIQFIQTDY